MDTFNWKKTAIIEGVVILLLLVGSGIFGPGLMKKYAKTEVIEKTKEVVRWKTVIKEVPKVIEGKVVYIKETTTEAVSDTDTDSHATDITLSTQQRNIVNLGLGIDNQASPSILLSASLLGPLGLAGEVTFRPDPIGFKGGHVWACLGL